MRMTDRIRGKIAAALDPERIEVVDESHLHIGHAGARPEGETHFRVTVVAPSFAGLSRMERQRRIYAILAEEMRERIHALSLTTLTPQEAEKR